MSGPLQDCTIDLIKPEPGQTVVVTVPKRGCEFIEAVGDQLKHSFPDNHCVVMEEGTRRSPWRTTSFATSSIWPRSISGHALNETPPLNESQNLKPTS